MSGMDTDELKAACEMAGGKCTSWCVVFNKDTPQMLLLGFEHETLLPYVAEILVAMVREQDPTAPYLAMALRDMSQWTEDPALAAAEQRIRACMGVLGGGE